MFKCQFTVLGRTEYHQFADRRNTGNRPLPLLWTQSRWAHQCPKPWDHGRLHSYKNIWAQKYLLPDPVEALIILLLLGKLRWVHSFLQDKDTICMVTIIISTNTDGGQVTKNLGSSKNLSQGILEFFHARYFVPVLGGKICRHLACCRSFCFPQLCSVYLCKTIVVPFLQSLPLYFMPDFRWLNGALLSQCHMYSFDASASMDFFLFKFGHNLSGKWL